MYESIQEPQKAITSSPSISSDYSWVFLEHQPKMWFTPSRTRTICTGHNHRVKYPCRIVLWALEESGRNSNDNL